MFRHIRVRAVWLALCAVPGLMWVASGTAVATSSTSCAEVQKFTSASFPSVPRINNTYQPWVPGMQFVLDGFVTGDDGLQHPHQIETTVTNFTKVINGVRTLVVFDRDFQDGVLQESEVFFQAQAADGAVWNIGEYPEEYENGVLAGAPSTWITGVERAKGGIGMLAHPTLGSPAYAQGIATSVGFFDCAVVYATGQHTCVPVRCYDSVLVTDEWAPRDLAGGHQRKFYAAGVGTVRVEAVGGVDPEVLQLTRAARVCGATLTRVLDAVVAQDLRGYAVSPHVYGTTPPIQATLPRPC
jgi:hypothetical protein